MRKTNRHGFSTLDVVVTIVILLVLAALFLPATRRTRPVARRSQCRNNLKQIGLALHNYHDVHRTLPPGWIASATVEQSSGFGWNHHILPFFDQEPLHRKFDTNRKLADTTSDNAELASRILTSARCPADTGPDQAKSSWMPLPATSNYVGNFGIGLPITYSATTTSTARLVDPKFVQGIFGANTRIRIHDVKDGMSNVVLVGERRGSATGVEWPIGKIEGPYSSYWAGIPNVAAVSPLVIVATATGGAIEHSVDGDRSDPDALPLTGNIDQVRDPESRKSLPYFAINRDVRGATLSRSDAVTAGFSSWHTGGNQMVLGDGTVRFISENIDPTIYTNLVRRSDGEKLGEF